MSDYAIIDNPRIKQARKYPFLVMREGAAPGDYIYHVKTREDGRHHIEFLRRTSRERASARANRIEELAALSEPEWRYETEERLERIEDEAGCNCSPGW